MRFLFLGGTRFIGRTIATIAPERGHEVTLFNRGTLDPDGLPGAISIRGDREKDLELLTHRRWDAVVDTCGYLPLVLPSVQSAENAFTLNRIRYFTSAYQDENGTNVFERNRTEQITP